MSGPLQSLWYNSLPGDGGTQVNPAQESGTSRHLASEKGFTNCHATCLHPQADSVFSGISTFGRLPYLPCLSSSHVSYDIAFIGL